MKKALFPLLVFTAITTASAMRHSPGSLPYDFAEQMTDKDTPTEDIVQITLSEKLIALVKTAKNSEQKKLCTNIGRLIEGGANPDAIDAESGMNALMLAAHARKRLLYGILVRHGADQKKEGRDGRCAHDIIPDEWRDTYGEFVHLDEYSGDFLVFCVML